MEAFDVASQVIEYAVSVSGPATEGIVLPVGTAVAVPLSQLPFAVGNCKA